VGQDTWEPISHMENSKELIDEFDKSYKVSSPLPLSSHPPPLFLSLLPFLSLHLLLSFSFRTPFYILLTYQKQKELSGSGGISRPGVGLGGSTGKLKKLLGKAKRSTTTTTTTSTTTTTTGSSKPFVKNPGMKYILILFGFFYYLFIYW
jgi:hypothetical protein